MYYQDKIEILKDLFGTDNVTLQVNNLLVENQTYPIIDDVIIMSPDFASDIQSTFGAEWNSYQAILPDHKKEFEQYFDIVDINSLKESRLCDLGCGNGRWSYFLKDRCKELILVDFSDAIFVTRKNLSSNNNCLFFKCDLTKLPFKDNFADFLFCLGVLHHLPTPCLEEIKALQRFAPALLIYLYYNLDNRPFYFRWLLRLVTLLRQQTSKIHNSAFRKLFSLAVTYSLYLPLIYLGLLLKPLRLSKYIPLYDAYHNKSTKRIEQDVYDRFFTGIEQRVSKNDILKLQNSFYSIKISDKAPFYHFLCQH